MDNEQETPTLMVYYSPIGIDISIGVGFAYYIRMAVQSHITVISENPTPFIFNCHLWDMLAKVKNRYSKKNLKILMCCSIVALFSCSSDSEDEVFEDEVIVYDDITLYVGESKVIEGDQKWISENELIAKIEGDEVKAVRVGTTLIKSGKYSFKVTVKSVHNSYKEPYLGFGDSMESIKSHMGGYELLKEKEDGLLYKGQGKVNLYIYLFDAGKMSSPGMVVDAIYTESLVDFIMDRYIPVSEEDGVYVFISVDKKYYVFMQPEVVGGQMVNLVAYMEISKAARLTNSIENFKVLFEYRGA